MSGATSSAAVGIRMWLRNNMLVFNARQTENLELSSRRGSITLSLLLATDCSVITEDNLPIIHAIAIITYNR